MLTLNRAAAYAPSFDKLERGEVALHVPLQDGAVQMGAKGETEEGKLIIQKGLGEALLTLEGSIAFQVELVYKTHDHRVVKQPVFANPIEQLELQRTRKLRGNGYWTPADKEVEVADEAAFSTFLNKVGAFGLLRQAKETILKP